MYDFVLMWTLFLMFKSFLCIVCERFLAKLTFVEVHYKKNANYFHQRPVRIEFISFQGASNKLKLELKSLYKYGSFHLLSAPPLWMSSGKNVTCRNRISEKYPVGIDSINLNPRNAANCQYLTGRNLLIANISPVGIC